jgi:hypothetical protein
VSLLNKQDVVAALAGLGELARAKGHEVHLLLLGGGLMMLRFETRPSTHDIGVVILPPSDPCEVPPSPNRWQLSEVGLRIG